MEVVAQGADITSCQAAVIRERERLQHGERPWQQKGDDSFSIFAQLFREKESEARELLSDEIYATPLW